MRIPYEVFRRYATILGLMVGEGLKSEHGLYFVITLARGQPSQIFQNV